LRPPRAKADEEKNIIRAIAQLPRGYRIEMGGNSDDSAKDNSALVPIFPIAVLRCVALATSAIYIAR